MEGHLKSPKSKNGLIEYVDRDTNNQISNEAVGP